MSAGIVPMYVIAFALSAAITFAMVQWGTRLGLVDEPGEHRSHDVATPRGGGVGIAAALIAVFAAFAGADEVVAPRMLLALLLGVVFVAGIGLADDRAALPPWPRLVVHLLVAAGVAWAGSYGDNRIAIVVFALGIAWSINLHNFMDGANGLLAGQAALVLGALAWVAGEDVFLAAFCGAGAAAALGFLPFNFPRARIFLGDVGSGVLGLLIGVAVWQAHARGTLALPAGLVLASGFVLDATFTLLWRIATGQRFWQRHREHLYQYLLRSGRSHVLVAAIYWAWTVAAAVLALRVMPPLELRLQWWLAAAVAGTGAILWALARMLLRGRLRES